MWRVEFKHLVGGRLTYTNIVLVKTERWLKSKASSPESAWSGVKFGRWTIAMKIRNEGPGLGAGTLRAQHYYAIHGQQVIVESIICTSDAWPAIERGLKNPASWSCLHQGGWVQAVKLRNDDPAPAPCYAAKRLTSLVKAIT